MEQKRCSVCSSPAQVFRNAEMDQDYFKCPRCGNFTLTSRAQAIMEKGSTSRQRSIVSSRIREAYQEDRIDEDQILKIRETFDKFPLDKLDRLLLYIYRKAPGIGASIALSTPSPDKLSVVPDYYALAYCWAMDLPELVKMLEMLKKMGFVESDQQRHPYLTAEGYGRIAELLHDNGTGGQCFVAMSFDKSLVPAYEESIRAGIEAAGYQPVRLDYEEHSDNIVDRMLMEIRRSRFVLADLTDKNPGAYFEAGFAKGLGLPVVWTCRKDQEEQKGNKSPLHFDVAQNNCIFWEPENMQKFRDDVARRIEGILGHGPLKKVAD